MITKIKEMISEFGKWISLALGVLLTVMTGAFLYEKSKRKNTEVELENEKYNTGKQVYEEKIKQSKEMIDAARKKLEEEKSRKVSDEELLEYLKKL